MHRPPELQMARPALITSLPLQPLVEEAALPEALPEAPPEAHPEAQPEALPVLPQDPVTPEHTSGGSWLLILL